MREREREREREKEQRRKWKTEETGSKEREGRADREAYLAFLRA